MKRAKMLLTVMTGMAVCAPVYAENPNTDADKFIPIYKRHKPQDPTRKRTPGMAVSLTVRYGGSSLTVEFPEDAESGMVTIGTGDFPVFTATVDRGNPTVELPPLSGDFLLTVSFDNEDVYEGEISM